MKHLSFAALTALSLAACATAPRAVDMGAPPALADAEDFARFEPKPDGRNTAIDYSVVDEFLEAAVVNLGPSTRTYARPARNPTNTRIRIGHQSKLRLEGNKVPFSQFDADTKAAAREYADSLVEIGNQIDIARLPRNEQLAYWFNLHNMLVIAEIAEAYPVEVPKDDIRIGPDRLPLHEAKLATIGGQALSLTDIRRNIVYRYWDDPRVIYGFFHGDLAGPSIRDDAWEARWLNRDLGRNAREFINSLRGVDRRGRDRIAVSPIYDEARGVLFKDWPDDLRKHLLDYANDEVTALLEERPLVEFGPYEERVADLAGGEPYDSLSPTETPGGMDPALAGLPVSVLSMMRDVSDKFEQSDFLKRRKAKITIIDPSKGQEDSGEVD